MKILDHSFTSPQDNLAFDEALLVLADKKGAGEFIRFWESPAYFIVLGRIGRSVIDVNPQTTVTDNIPVLRRSSGGGTVVQGIGCLNYACVLSKEHYPVLNDLRQSYQWISQRVIDALIKQGIKAQFCPISDIATVDGKKFSGNAQHRGKNYILHHGTILYRFNLDVISRYLSMPVDMPEYRKARSHQDFVTNIPIDPSKFKQDFVASFNLAYQAQPITDQELLVLKEVLVRTNFS